MLAKLHALGLSFSKIAERIVGVSRNACIGKARRMGLPERSDTSFTAPQRRNGKRSAKKCADLAVVARGDKFRSRWLTLATGKRGEVAPKPQTSPRTPPPTLDEIGRTLAVLTADHCRWPEGEGRDIHFPCPEKRQEGSSYCPYHHGRTRAVEQPARLRARQSAA